MNSEIANIYIVLFLVVKSNALKTRLEILSFECLLVHYLIVFRPILWMTTIEERKGKFFEGKGREGKGKK